MDKGFSYKFDGKRALVTGAGRGIGNAIAIALAKCGAETYALAKTQANLDALVAECNSIHPVCVDLADWSATRKAVEALPPIDFLVNNAAVAKLDSFLDVTPEDIDISFEINVKAVINVSQVVAKSLISRGSGGSIVNVSSQSGKRALLDHTVYCATKGALDMTTKVMALELGPHKIRVNSVNPTVVMTDMGRKNWSDDTKRNGMLSRIPLSRFAEVSEVVGPVLYLLSDEASMVHGHFMMIDGGYTVG